MVCTSATGQAVPPFVILKGMGQRDAYSRGMPIGSTMHMSDSGYMTSEIFSTFLDRVSRYKPQGKVLLILDGHAAHCKDPDVLEKA
jgi:hypothetical protein